MTFDLGPATERVGRVVQAVRDDQLGGPTPCAGATVADLLDHMDGLCLAFTAAATKTRLPGDQQTPHADGARLAEGWRVRIAQRLSALAEAWRAPDAWAGMTQAGPVQLPGEVAAAVALNEVIVHGWDIARSTGQDYDVDPGLVGAAHAFVQASVAQNPNGSPGLFGPPVDVGADAGPTAQLLGLTGRDPFWAG